jgi:hypothetical protein
MSGRQLEERLEMEPVDREAELVHAT